MNSVSTYIGRVIELVLEDAKERATSAGYSGRHDDGGSGMLEMQVRFYRAGQAGAMPLEWEKFEKQARLETDPDYVKYLELHKKFGGR